MKNGGGFFQCQCNNDVWRIKWKSGRIPSHQGTVIDDGDQKSVCHSEKISDGRVLDVFDEQLENTRIMIYPCINLVLMREDVNGLLGSFSDEVKDNEVDGQENLEWSSEETLSENDMTDEESDLEPEEMNVDEEGETEDGTDESGI